MDAIPQVSGPLPSVPPPLPMVPPPLPLPPLAPAPLNYERMAQPVKPRVVCEAHEDGISFTQYFSPGRALGSPAWWAVLMAGNLLMIGLLYLQARYDFGRPHSRFWVVVVACLTGWTLFRIACELRAWGQPVVLAVRGGKLAFTRPTLGRRRHTEWPVDKVKRIDVAVGSATQHATKALRIRFQSGGRILFFEGLQRDEGVWIARKLAALMDLPDSAIH